MKRKILRNTWKTIKKPAPRKEANIYAHGEIHIFELTERRKHSGGKRAFPQNLFCVPPQNCLVNSNSPPSGFQQRGHTQGGPLAATSNRFPGEAAQEVKLLQETLNRAPIVPSPNPE